ncbi:MAG: dephospho-CoA kinase [Clostridia bacterium]|nr:dephospho-CoA kinase [Clostridia bacterium]
MKILGVTGGSGTGKTVVCRILKEQGGKIIDADVVSKKMQQKDGPAYHEIVAYFGPGIVGADGELDRKALGAIVFNDRGKMQVLNSIVHKYVSAEMKRRVEGYREQGDIPFVVLDVPIPIEDGFFDTCNTVWAVVANDDLRISRLMKRMMISEAEAVKRIAAQMSNREYSDLADCVIENEGDVEELKKLVLFELRRFLEF